MYQRSTEGIVHITYEKKADPSAAFSYAIVCFLISVAFLVLRQGAYQEVHFIQAIPHDLYHVALAIDANRNVGVGSVGKSIDHLLEVGFIQKFHLRVVASDRFLSVAL